MQIREGFELGVDNCHYNSALLLTSQVSHGQDFALVDQGCCACFCMPCLADTVTRELHSLLGMSTLTIKLLMLNRVVSCHQLPSSRHQHPASRQGPQAKLITGSKTHHQLTKIPGTVMQYNISWRDSHRHLWRYSRIRRRYSLKQQQQQQTSLTMQEGQAMLLYNRTRQLRDNRRQVQGRHLDTFQMRLQSQRLKACSLSLLYRA